ncbi:biotin transporter BioY [Methanoregula sp. PtaB.Bin085]|uniref:biotin transporter BioY n=1 Tax=Methanoregula sp. PtaB.Bin085 TaxID=1811680 RepID=UPI0009C8E6D8|nr:biotin transporter BioY [Methanoregula sp. PtaB.Bin085]OPX65466.1 MAG: BioY family protein [Methanoregula sp. PtaB.Bin085]
MFGNPVRSRLIAHTAAFIGLIAIGSWISIPCIPVPFTLQTLFVLLAGAVMKRYAVIPVFLYVLLGALGLPLFHNGLAGIGVLLGPTGGYLIGFVAAVLVTGLSYEHSSRPVRVCGLALATILIYACGVAWLMYSLDRELIPAFMAGALPFIIGDTIKAAAAYVIADRLP